MLRAFSQDLRDRVIDAVFFEGQTRRGVAARFGVSPSTVVKCVQAATDEKRRDPVIQATIARLPGVQDWLLLQVQDHPDQTLKMLCSRLLCEKAVSADPGMLSRFFKKIGIRFKKTLFATEQDRPDVADRCNQWQKAICPHIRLI